MRHDGNRYCVVADSDMYHIVNMQSTRQALCGRRATEYLHPHTVLAYGLAQGLLCLGCLKREKGAP